LEFNFDQTNYLWSEKNNTGPSYTELPAERLQEFLEKINPNESTNPNNEFWQEYHDLKQKYFENEKVLLDLGYRMYHAISRVETSKRKRGSRESVNDERVI
jgi:hypothetical protein